MRRSAGKRFELHVVIILILIVAGVCPAGHHKRSAKQRGARQEAPRRLARCSNPHSPTQRSALVPPTESGTKPSKKGSLKRLPIGKRIVPIRVAKHLAAQRIVTNFLLIILPHC